MTENSMVVNLESLALQKRFPLSRQEAAENRSVRKAALGGSIFFQV